MLRRKRVLAAKIEGTIGTAETLTAAEATVNCYNIEIQATIPMTDRPKQGQFSHASAIAGARMGVVSFRTYLSGDGAAGEPTWATTFLPACGWVATAQVYSPVTEPPGSNVKTITIGVYEDGFKKFISGAVGTFKFVMTAGVVIAIDWTFTGVWNAPVDATILAPTYDTNIPLRFGTATLTLGGGAIGCIQELTIDAGNKVVMRECPTNVSGYVSGLIGDRRVVGSFNPESRLAATENVFAHWLASTEAALSVSVTDGTDTITIAAPKTQRLNIQEGDRGGNQIDNIDFGCNASAAAGNDELTITFA